MQKVNSMHIIIMSLNYVTKCFLFLNFESVINFKMVQCAEASLPLWIRNNTYKRLIYTKSVHSLESVKYYFLDTFLFLTVTLP